MTFRVGQKVVCVNGDFSVHWHVVLNRPATGAVYTIRAITSCSFGPYKNTPSLLLEEVTNPKTLWDDFSYFECPFAAARFRPLVERKTDISIFTAMLTPKKTRVRA